MVLSKNANNKGADQTARMRRLVCACVVRKPPKTGYLALRPKCDKPQILFKIIYNDNRYQCPFYSKCVPNVLILSFRHFVAMGCTTTKMLYSATREKLRVSLSTIVTATSHLSHSATNKLLVSIVSYITPTILSCMSNKSP